jgi:hypothetical protein
VTSPNWGKGRRSCERAIVAPLKPVLEGIRPRKGFVTDPPSSASLTVSRVRELDRYRLGMELMLRSTGRFVPREPTYRASTTQPAPRSRWTPSCQRV